MVRFRRPGWGSVFVAIIALIVGVARVDAASGASAGASFNVAGHASQAPAPRSAGGYYKVLYSFRGAANGADGANPRAGLISANGLLFGTTFAGGFADCYANLGCGTVFAVNAAGVEHVLHRFSFGGTDGNGPAAGLTAVGGILYGVTEYGGYGGSDDCLQQSPPTRGCGTLFAVTPSGAETVLHRFADRDEYPSGPLTDVGGNLYGTTTAGSVYKTSLAGAYKNIYLFPSSNGPVSYPAGTQPVGSLVYLNDELYGSTFGGGPISTEFSGLCPQGTNFALSLTGTLRTLNYFSGDGCDVDISGSPQNPTSGLSLINGQLYGTAANGGPAKGCSFTGCGGVYGFSPTNSALLTLNVELSGPTRPFEFATAGANAVIGVGGSLFGTTRYGGSTATQTQQCAGNGCGTIFEICPLGLLVLYDFTPGNGGWEPTGPLTYVNGVFYGTTEYGGAYGQGTVFAFKP